VSNALKRLILVDLCFKRMMQFYPTADGYVFSDRVNGRHFKIFIKVNTEVKIKLGKTQAQ
jgi:hypothetical protein